MCWWRKRISCSRRSLIQEKEDLLVAANQIHNYSNSDIDERSFTVRAVQQLHSHRPYWPVFLPWTRTSSPAELGAAGRCSGGCRTVERRKIDKIWLIDRTSSLQKPSALLMQGDLCEYIHRASIRLDADRWFCTSYFHQRQ